MLSGSPLSLREIAKYAGAQELGIPADDVRLVIVHTLRHSADHIIVVVYQAGEWFILDNLTNVLVGIGKGRTTSLWLFWITRASAAIFLLFRRNRDQTICFERIHPSSSRWTPDPAYDRSGWLVYI